MTLLRGTRIGSYDVVEPIGAGGMGEVYSAHDARLGRRVALKVLPAGVASDADRLARLQREARTLASLNHPHIAQIYGLEEAAGVTALVMELVEGPTLAERIAQGAMSIEEALPIARQIADALEAAHEQGIIHRDLKPANIKVRPDGTVKVLDFGLARAVESSTGSSSSLLPTLTSPAMMTGVGVVMGTAAYMSPEQAKGRPVDRRADIWAFGVVLVEMLTGRTMFAGESVTETMASVMKDVPVIPDAPPAIRALLGRCLERDPRRRLRDIGEARIVLEDPASLDVERVAPVPAEAPAASRRTWAWAAGVLLAAVAAGAGAWLLRPAPQSDAVPLRKFSLSIEGLNLGPATAPKISPDGQKIVYANGGQLFVRDLSSLAPRQLTTGERPTYFAWSPDSSQIAYIAGDRLYKVALAGGAPSVVTVLRQSLGSGVGLWWGDGRIVLTTAIPGTGIQQVSEDGGDLTTIVPAESPAEQDFHEVSILPDGRGLLYAVDRGSGTVDTLAVATGTEKKTILHLEGEFVRFPVYVESGHILYERTTNNAGVWAIPFSLSTLDATGDPFLVAPLSALPSVSDDGTLVFVRQAPPVPSELITVDLSGKVVATVGKSQDGQAAPRVSPDGRLVAAAAQSNTGADVWIHDVARGGLARVTFGESDEFPQAWSPAGDRVFFLSRVLRAQTRTIWAQATDGTGQAVAIGKSRNPGALDVSRDGRFLAYSDLGKDIATGQDLYYVALEGGAAQPVLFLEAPTSQTEPRFSPDGRYLAYQSNESGRTEVYLKAFPSGDGKWQVSINGGAAPRWDASGRLFFIEPGEDAGIMQVEITRTPALTIGTPRRLFGASAIGRRTGNGWDVFPDGKRFVLPSPVPVDNPPPPSITLVQNWFAEFRDRH